MMDERNREAFISMLDGSCFSVLVTRNATVLDLKAEIAESRGYNIGFQNLFSQDKEVALQNELILSTHLQSTVMSFFLIIEAHDGTLNFL